MNAQELGRQLQGKRRTTADLARFISTRTDHNPNYTLLLGAGCSITSGIRSANELIAEWRSELCPDIADVDEQRDHLKRTCGDWYDPNREYSSLFEKKYDLQRQRRMFVEKEVSGKTPSLGYAYLTSLVNQNYFNTIFTTNFDDLLNEAFYLFSDHRPIVCAHDSSINSITVTSKRPKIIKLHGDYLFDDLKSTSRETESLEQNMKAKFSEFAKDYGLIVVGYAGNDRSIMEAVSLLLKNDEYFKGGIYWCLRKDSEVSEDLRKLLWREKVYFVEIEGFDELFCELYCKFNEGELLPLSTLAVSRRPTEIVSRLVTNQSILRSASPYLIKAVEQLAKQSKRTTLMDMILRSDKDDSPRSSKDRFSDDELITQLEIQNAITAENYRDAISKGRSALKSDIGPASRNRVLRLIVQAHRNLNEFNEAVSVAEELIKLQPHTAAPHLLKADLLQDHEAKLSAIEKAIEANPYAEESYHKKAALYQRIAHTQFGEERQVSISTSLAALDIGISRDPSITNPCWRLKFDVIQEHTRDEHEKSRQLNEIIEKLSVQSPMSYHVLSMRASLLSDGKDHIGIEKLLSEIEDIKARNIQEPKPYLDDLRLTVLAYLNDIPRIKDAITTINSAYVLLRHSELAATVAELQREKLGDDESAISLLHATFNNEFDSTVFKRLVDAMLDIGRIQDAESLLEKWSNKLSPEIASELKIDVFEAKKDFDGALAELKKWTALSGTKNDAARLYLMLRKGSYIEVEQLGRQILTPINFLPEAEVETINFEIATKRLKNKVNTQRLENILRFTASPNVKAAASALLGRKGEMLEHINSQMSRDKTFRFSARRWPAFEEFREDRDFIKALAIK